MGAEDAPSKGLHLLLQQLSSAQRFIESASADRKGKTNDCMSQSLKSAINVATLKVDEAVQLQTAIRDSSFSPDAKAMLNDAITDHTTRATEVVSSVVKVLAWCVSAQTV